MREECSHGNLARSCGQCDTECALSDAHKRIAELERELTEQARLNGMGSEREAALMAKVERLERENEKMSAYMAGLESHVGHDGALIEKLKEELAAAQATISRMREVAESVVSLKLGPSGFCSSPLFDLRLGAISALTIPNDRTALDAMLAEARREGMLAAAEIAKNGGAPTGDDFGAWESDSYKAIRQAAGGE